VSGRHHQTPENKTKLGKVLTNCGPTYFYEIYFVFASGSVVVKALCYKPEGRGFDSLPAALGPVVYSASNRNEYQKH
jgi:hypothetical protein